jgi:hypothetical protein
VGPTGGNIDAAAAFLHRLLSFPIVLSLSRCGLLSLLPSDILPSSRTRQPPYVHYEGYQEVIIPINDLAANYDKLADKAAARKLKGKVSERKENPRKMRAGLSRRGLGVCGRAPRPTRLVNFRRRLFVYLAKSSGNSADKFPEALWRRSSQ